MTSGMEQPAIRADDGAAGADDLGDIARAAAQLEGGAGAPQLDGPAAPTAPARDPDALAREWAQCPFIFGSIVCEAMPELRPVYTEDRCIAWGRAMVPVAEKHGWNVPAVLMYASLAAATWGMVRPTIRAAVAHRQAHQAGQAAPGQAAQGAGQPGAGTARPGQPGPGQPGAEQGGAGRAVTVTDGTAPGGAAPS